jgi:hypothetical protein
MGWKPESGLQLLPAAHLAPDCVVLRMGDVQSFSQTETCEPLSVVKGSRFQFAQR